MSRLTEWAGHAWLALPVRLYMGGLFVYASVHKIAYPELFALDVATYDILPLPLVNLSAITLPYVELAAGAMLVVGFRTRTGATLVTGMLLMFLIALVIALARGLDMSCGCFASQAMEEDPITRMTVLRDFIWIVLASYVWVFDRSRIGIDRLLEETERG
jgi:uncharacterized membrane protein YphA (DoxX/SURF4 family)